MANQDADLSWRPNRQVFLRRSLILAALTFVVFSFPILSFASAWFQSLLIPLAMTLIFAMDDFNRWRQVRNEHWCIEDGSLIHEGQEGRGVIPLSDIASAKPRLGYSVVIKLHSGQRIMMRYLLHPKQTADHINNICAPLDGK